MLQSLLEALIEDIAQDAAIGQYDRQCPTSCPDENHSDAHDVSETRHQHSLNGLKPGPRAISRICYNDRLVGAWHRVAVPVSTGGGAATATSKTAPLSHKTTPSFANGKPHPTFDCCVGDNSAGWQWYHSSAQWCHRMLTRRPHHRCWLHLHLKSISCLF